MQSTLFVNCEVGESISAQPSCTADLQPDKDMVTVVDAFGPA